MQKAHSALKRKMFEVKQDRQPVTLKTQARTPGRILANADSDGVLTEPPAS
jgi:hypothetical protein